VSDVTTLLGKRVHVLISGNKSFRGELTDLGEDILVLFDGQQFVYVYIPLLHVHRINHSNIDEDTNNPSHFSLAKDINHPSEPSLAEEMESISYRSILENAKGRFIEIYVTGNKSFHGYITNVLSDYFVFYSPVYKVMFIPFHHLKWLTPYNRSITPYTLSNEKLPVNPSNVPFLRSLEEQLKTLEGKLVVFDGGEDPMKIGLLKKVKDNLVELAIANGESVYLTLTHIKSVHTP
jgi:hypothetical protein